MTLKNRFTAEKAKGPQLTEKKCRCGHCLLHRNNMIKYVPKMTSVVLEEIPDRVSLAVDISNCRGNCVGCHSPFLKLDIGEELTPAVVDDLITDNFGVNCFLFLGEGRDPEALLSLAGHIRTAHPAMEIALYSGREDVEPAIWDAFDYVKVGPYRPECGPLNERTTNQRLYYHKEDITFRFWRKGIDPNV